MVTIKVKTEVPQTMDEGDNPTFDKWMARIDSVLSKHIGLTSADLDDCRYMDWYEQRLRPIRAANRALKRSGADYF